MRESIEQMTAPVNQKMTDLQSFLSALEQIRRERNLTWAEIAKKSNINRQYLGDIMKGKRKPKAATQEKIARSLGFELTAFLSLSKSFAEEIEVPGEDWKEKYIAVMEKYIAEVEDHKETRKKLAETKEKLEAALTTPTVSDMGTVTTISDLGAGIKAEKE